MEAGVPFTDVLNESDVEVLAEVGRGAFGAVKVGLLKGDLPVAIKVRFSSV